MAGHSAPSIVAPRPPPKPPDPASAVAPGALDPPISSLTQMRTGPWCKWFKLKGTTCSFGDAFPNLAQRILEGIEHGVPVDYKGDRSISRYGPNLPILPEHEPKVTAVIDADVRAGKKADPFDSPPFANFCVSPIGAVPKRMSDKIRVIHHLSFPHGGDSVNAGVVDEGMSISSFGHAARAVRTLGEGCLLIKLDVEAAYKQVPVRREDWHLLGFKWRGKYYYERVLPFGLRSSCRLWEMYATALHFLCETVLKVDAPHIVIHYVDDFLFVVKSEPAASQLLREALALCAELGLPMAAAKTEGPTTKLTFLGLDLDTKRMEASLPAERLADLQHLLMEWSRLPTESASVRQLQSLTGMLNFACAVVRPGRFYLRRIINHTSRLEALIRQGGADGSRIRAGVHAPFKLTQAVLDDIAWWAEFLPRWDGVSLLYELDWERAERIELFTDACKDGYGAMFGSAWFAGAWSPEQMASAQRRTRYSMPFLELHALVQAAATWGPLWRGKKIIFRCDAHAAVQAIAACRSRDPGMMHLLRTLSTIACDHGFDFRCEHIAGVSNVAADLLSRYGGDSVQFRAACPDADQHSALAVPIALPPREE